MPAISGSLNDATLPLSQVFLDPNNPRFVTDDWRQIGDSSIDKEDVQATAKAKLENQYAVDRLQTNMEENGYLPVDRIVVKKFKTDKYVVLEGNRRVAAAKNVQTLIDNGTVFEAAITNSFRTIPVLIYTGQDVQAAWMFQGLIHIMGVRDWSPFNKAKLLVERMTADELSLTEIGRQFGLTGHGAGQWVRGYNAYQQAKEETDYASDISQESYPYFQELFGRSNIPLRTWLDWQDEPSYRFGHIANFNEFVGWLYPRNGDEDDGDDRTIDRWENRKFAKRDEIRYVSKLLHEDSEFFQEFRVTGDIDSANAKSITAAHARDIRDQQDSVEQLMEVMTICLKNLNNAPLRIVRDPELKSKFTEVSGQINSAISTILDDE